MTESQRIADQLHRSVEGPAWHGPALLELLEGMTPQQAAARPIKGWKSTWELVLHAIVWQDIVRLRMAGKPAGRPPNFKLGGPLDWPRPPRATQPAWKAVIAKLRRASRALERDARAFPAAKLDKPFVPGGATAYVALHGAVQHTLWHAGQIATLKRALGLPAVKTKPE